MNHPKNDQFVFEFKDFVLFFAFFFPTLYIDDLFWNVCSFFLSRFGDEKKNHQSAIKTIEKVNKNGK